MNSVNSSKRLNVLYDITAALSVPLVARINRLVEDGEVEFEGDDEGDGHLPEDLMKFEKWGHEVAAAATVLNEMIQEGLIDLEVGEDGYLWVIR